MNRPSKPRTRVARWTGALLLGFFVLFGCSKLKFALGLVPWYAERQALAKLPELTDGQRRVLKADIQRYWSWNKAHMMPAYGAALRNIAAGLTSTAEGGKDIALTSALLTGLYAQSLEPLLKPTSALLHSFDSAQITGLEARFREHQEAQRKLYLSDPEKTLRTRIDKLRATLEDWGGKLSSEQRTRLEALVRGFPIPYQAWLDDRVRREAELIAVLRERRSESLLQALLRDWWLRPRSGGEDREAWQWDEHALERHVKDVLGVLEPGQKAQISRKLTELAGELESLAVEPVPALKPTATGG